MAQKQGDQVFDIQRRDGNVVGMGAGGPRRQGTKDAAEREALLELRGMIDDIFRHPARN
jgi:hypothetical protein